LRISSPRLRLFGSPAFDVPAGPTLAPWAIPLRLACFARLLKNECRRWFENNFRATFKPYLPQCKVALIALLTALGQRAFSIFEQGLSKAELRLPS
jgi:hypothetical protein